MHFSYRRRLAFAIFVAAACDSTVSPSGVETVASAGRVVVTTEAVSLVVGQTRQLSNPGSAAQGTWQNDNSAAVTVSPTGLVSALAPGIAHLVARQKLATETAIITVRAPVDGVQFIADSTSLATGQSARLSFRAFDASGATIDNATLDGSQIKWSSTLPSIAAVDSAGVVSASAIGRTAIVMSIDGKTDTAIVNVVPVRVAMIVLTVPAQFGLASASSYKITAIAKDASGNDLSDRPFTWSSSDSTVATVSQTGVVTGVSVGSAHITVSSEGRAASTDVIVSSAAVASVTASLAAGTVVIAQTTQATAVARDAKGNVLSGRYVLWSSDAPAVATVSNLGAVNGVAAGAATIRALVDGVAGSATIKVVSSPAPAPVAAIGVGLTPSSLTVGQLGQAVATPRDSAGNILAGRAVAWISLNPSIAAVSSTTGVVTGVSAGSVVIQALIDGVVGQASLTVSVPSVITSPTPTSGTLAAHDFEDGTLGPFWNPWGTGIDVVSDPTPRASGKVARVHYVTDAGVTQWDDNKALLPSNVSIGLGDSLWFQGSFFLPATDDMTASGSGVIQRKLLYWGWNGYGAHPFDMVVALFGPQMAINNLPHQSFDPGGQSYLPVYVTAGIWHTLKVQLKLNSSFAAFDGVLRIWYDGALVFDHTDMRWTDPSWTDLAPSNYKWTNFNFGEQVSAGVAVNEYRYWDDVTFAKTLGQP